MLSTFALWTLAGCGEASFESYGDEDQDQQSVQQRVCSGTSGQVEIVSRAKWGARSARSRRPAHTPREITIHHTVQGNISGPAAVRAVQSIHMDGNGWSDVGYHFLVDRDGTIIQAGAAAIGVLLFASGPGMSGLLSGTEPGRDASRATRNTDCLRGASGEA